MTTFTVLPLPAGRVDRRVAAGAMLLAPLVGLGLGVLAAVTMLASRVAVGSTVGGWPSAVVALATLALATGGLHLDGLADTADGLAAHRPPAEALAVMRRGDVGPVGVVTVVLVLLGQAACLQLDIVDHVGTAAVVLAAVVPRTVVVWACRRGVPPARGDGLGALVAGTVHPAAAVPVTAAVAGLVWLVTVTSVDSPANLPHRTALAAAGGLLAGWLLTRLAVRRLGGITGDVLGWLVELTALVVLYAMAVLPV